MESAAVLEATEQLYEKSKSEPELRAARLQVERLRDVIPTNDLSLLKKWGARLASLNERLEQQGREI